jgi:hypothetical protein
MIIHSRRGNKVLYNKKKMPYSYARFITKFCNIFNTKILPQIKVKQYSSIDIVDVANVTYVRPNELTNTKMTQFIEKHVPSPDKLMIFVNNSANNSEINNIFTTFGVTRPVFKNTNANSFKPELAYARNDVGNVIVLYVYCTNSDDHFNFQCGRKNDTVKVARNTYNLYHELDDYLVVLLYQLLKTRLHNTSITIDSADTYKNILKDLIVKKINTAKCLKIKDFRAFSVYNAKRKSKRLNAKSKRLNAKSKRLNATSKRLNAKSKRLNATSKRLPIKSHHNHRSTNRKRV